MTKITNSQNGGTIHIKMYLEAFSGTAEHNGTLNILLVY